MVLVTVTVRGGLPAATSAGCSAIGAEDAEDLEDLTSVVLGTGALLSSTASAVTVARLVLSRLECLTGRVSTVSAFAGSEGSTRSLSTTRDSLTRASVGRASMVRASVVRASVARAFVTRASVGRGSVTRTSAARASMGRASITFASAAFEFSSFLDRFSTGLLSVCGLSSTAEAMGLFTDFSGVGSVTRRTGAFFFAMGAGGADSRCTSAALGWLG